MKTKYNILFIEDNLSDVEFMERELTHADIEFVSKRVENREGFMEALANFLPDIIICDHALPRFDSRAALKIMKETKQDIPFLLVTGTLSDEYAVESLREGAYDYVLKSKLMRLPFSVKNALVKYQLVQEKHIIEHQKDQIQKNSDENAEKNKGITASILYAKEIQKAILPKQSYIDQYFPESFLINMPKDIVSGDFYWFSEHDGKFIVAVGDCTGHGVPAALISMMGYNKLNYIVTKMGETDPALILDQLNMEVREVFSQDDSLTSIKDGMDISICTIDKKNGTLQFAGANRPLYYVKDQQLEVIKGDKKCIGGILGEDVSKNFTHHTIATDSITNIYLFTDGFIDQFGGIWGKKFLCKRLRGLLSSGHLETMTCQKEMLLSTLNAWKGDTEQTDDICMVGIRL